MNAHAKLAVDALERMKGDDLIRFENRYGRPGTPSSKLTPEGWDMPIFTGADTTFRQSHAGLARFVEQIDWAIGWVRSKG